MLFICLKKILGEPTVYALTINIINGITINEWEEISQQAWQWVTTSLMAWSTLNQ
jgi:hypothetical protein